MEEFLNNLYSYEYFGFYLIISIIVLVILFIVILFFGKKDQKIREIEATKKLQQINREAFKEEMNEQKLELSNEPYLDDTIVVPSINDVPVFNNVDENDEIPEPVIPVLEEQNNLEEQKTEIPVVSENKELEEIDFEPLLEKIEEKPLAIDNTNIFSETFINEVTSSEEVKPVVEQAIEMPKIEITPKTEEIIEMPKVEIKPVIEDVEIEVPEFNFDEIVKEAEEVKQNESYNKGPQIFSSVYVPEKKEETKIEIPIIKEEEDLGFELPTLKKDEEKIEVPLLNDYNLDELSGESYTINR